MALLQGLRGFAGWSSATGTSAHQGAGQAEPFGVPRLSERQFLAWADQHFARTGDWPHQDTGDVIAGPPGETWKAIEMALFRTQEASGRD